jgi:hypothetical protein
MTGNAMTATPRAAPRPIVAPFLELELLASGFPPHWSGTATCYANCMALTYGHTLSVIYTSNRE